MPTVLQFRRGTTTQNNAFTGNAGELSVDTTLDTVRIHDGSTAGGFTLTQNAATQTLTNKTLTSPVLTTPTVATSITINAAGELRFGDSDTSNYVGFKSPGTVGSNVIWTLPSADGSSGQALVTDASGNLSFAAAGATISADTSTNTNFLLYFASTTTGALTAVKQDSGLIYNPSTGSLSSSVFIGNLTGVASSVTSQANSATTTAASTNTANQIVLRDGSGNLTAGTITALATSARYADLAERYTADADYEPGTVVELGGEQEVTQTTRPISVAIAGIVSTDPAYLMNADLTDGISVALIGRIPCKVIGTIHKGDILVSSLTPGHAEAHRDIHSPPAGSVIGKAIESKSNDGSGVIEVLVGRL